MFYYFLLTLRYFNLFKKLMMQVISYADTVLFKWVKNFLLAFVITLLVRLLFFAGSYGVPIYNGVVNQYLYNMKSKLEHALLKYQSTFGKVVDFNAATEQLYHLDFTAANTELTTALVTDTQQFSAYINNKLNAKNCKYGIGGYNEDRILYTRSKHFEVAAADNAPLEGAGETRSIHLGIDIWGPAGTKVYVPIGGTVHSFAYNDNFGDYGATIVLQHQLDTVLFHTLYGHLSLNDLVPLQEGKYISRGELLGHFGEEKENGNWPPHLHFQVIEDMRLYEGDYPGVCSIDEREKYLLNCPDADLILKMMQFI